ncbi:acyl-CoA thioesterase [Vaginella massiliensis]|uniref:acyl-CoA thioesterase n=1 Tax=Vaginella massiliensis TaxID=1816680 RepID=UPI003751F4C9
MNVNLENFKFYKNIEIRWNDLDPIGHVNNVYYFEYFQIGRGYYMTEMSKNWDWMKHMFVIANISCQYFKELRLTHRNVQLGIRISAIGNKSFDFEYVIVSDDKNGERIVHALGTSTQVLIDLSINKSIEIPVWLRSDMIAYEPNL